MRRYQMTKDRVKASVFEALEVRLGLFKLINDLACFVFPYVKYEAMAACKPTCIHKDKQTKKAHIRPTSWPGVTM